MGGISGLAYSALSIAGDKMSAKQARKAASKQRSWAKGMERSRYKRTMLSMKDAGLNPMLVASLGGGSSPPGAMATDQDVNVGGAIQTGLQARRETTERKLMQAETGLKSQQEETSYNQGMLMSDQGALARAHTRAAGAQEGLLREQEETTALKNQQLKLQLPYHITENQIESSRFGIIMRYLGRLNPFGSAVRAATGRIPTK